MRVWVVVLLVAGSVTAHAGGEADVDAEIARRHYQEGIRFYQASDYRNALKEFSQARTVMRSPALDFNIGRCHDRLEHLSEAIVAYQRYVDAEPKSADAPEVIERIRVLKERLAAQGTPIPTPPPVTATPPPVTATPPTPSPPPSTLLVASPAPPPKPLVKRAWFWIAIGGATAVVVTGIALGVTLGSSTTHPMPTLGTVPGN
jgi:hypothetical protein